MTILKKESKDIPLFFDRGTKENKQMKYFYVTVSAISGIITLWFIWLVYQRSQFPYNEEGRYFDAENVISYDSSGITVFSIFAGIGLIATGLFVYGYLYEKRREINAS